MAVKSKTTKKRSRNRKKQKAEGVNLQLVKALSHELRVEILTILNERVASPNELSKELGEGLSQVSYHVKVLRDYGCITQVKTVPRRGAVEHYYRATSRPYINDRDWQKLPDSVREGMSADLIQMVIEDASAALEAGTIDAHKDRHMSRTPLLLDGRGLQDVGEILTGALEQILQVQSESTDRLAKDGDDSLEAVVAMMGFEVPIGRPKKPKSKAKKK